MADLTVTLMDADLAAAISEEVRHALRSTAYEKGPARKQLESRVSSTLRGIVEALPLAQDCREAVARELPVLLQEEVRSALKPAIRAAIRDLKDSGEFNRIAIGILRGRETEAPPLPGVRGEEGTLPGEDG